MNDLLLVLLVFAAVAAAVIGVAGLVGGMGGRRLRHRLDALTDSHEIEQSISAIRARYLRQLSPIERRLEELPGMASLAHSIERAGWSVPAYRVTALSLGLGLVGAILAVIFLRSPLAIPIGAIVLGMLPILKLNLDGSSRLEKFEQQLPDALDLMTRSLRAGNPLMESFKFVSEEMKPPVSTDFGRAWSNVNYGVSLKASLMDLVERTPSASLRSLSTAIMVQRETGGNLAEILEKIAKIMRDRARFQRRVRTLTAEGRMSGWVLGCLPLFMAGVLSWSTPNYIPILFTDPQGKKLLMISVTLLLLGAFWISRIVKVKV
jgi:tight adherence protein B